MAEAMRIRARMQGDAVDVRVLVAHPMETGSRRDAKGALVPIHFIQRLTVSLNGRKVLDAQLSQAVSRDPFFGFRLRGGKPGDTVSIAWIDNRGERQSTETRVAAG